jgi:hypothetical protein
LSASASEHTALVSLGNPNCFGFYWDDFVEHIFNRTCPLMALLERRSGQPHGHVSSLGKWVVHHPTNMSLGCIAV